MAKQVLWVVTTPTGKQMVLTDGACSWARRADAMNAAETYNHGEGWPALRAAGWTVERVVSG